MRIDFFLSASSESRRDEEPIAQSVRGPSGRLAQKAIRLSISIDEEHT
jgi:hypothetical protein